jgi:hypothetical protein
MAGREEKFQNLELSWNYPAWPASECYVVVFTSHLNSFYGRLVLRLLGTDFQKL